MSKEFSDKPCDPLRQKSRLWALLAGLSLLPGALCLLFIAKIWQFMIPLGTPAFLLVSAGLALCLLIAPLLSLAGFGLALVFHLKAGRPKIDEDADEKS